MQMKKENEKLIGIKKYNFNKKNIIDKRGFGFVYKALDLNGLYLEVAY